MLQEAAERCPELVPRSYRLALQPVPRAALRAVFTVCKKAAHARSGDTDGYTRNQEPPHSLPTDRCDRTGGRSENPADRSALEARRIHVVANT